MDWGPEYLNCSEWGDVFLLTQGVVPEWPEGSQVMKWKLIFDGKTCVPSPLQEKLIYDHHEFLGHVGFSRLWEHMILRYLFGDILSAKKVCKGGHGWVRDLSGLQKA